VDNPNVAFHVDKQNKVGVHYVPGVFKGKKEYRWATARTDISTKVKKTGRPNDRNLMAGQRSHLASVQASCAV
jgi:hypothetical protein